MQKEEILLPANLLIFLLFVMKHGKFNFCPIFPQQIAVLFLSLKSLLLRWQIHSQRATSSTNSRYFSAMICLVPRPLAVFPVGHSEDRRRSQKIEHGSIFCDPLRSRSQMIAEAFPYDHRRLRSAIRDRLRSYETRL